MCSENLFGGDSKYSREILQQQGGGRFSEERGRVKLECKVEREGERVKGGWKGGAKIDQIRLIVLEGCKS